MVKSYKWIIEMREVYLVFGLLLMAISFFKDNFDFLGYYFVFGALIILFSILLYIINFFNRFNID